MSLAGALAQWRRLLGADRVLADESGLARYRRTTLRHAPSTAAVVRPGRVEQVAKILRIAGEQRVSIYPISRGCNWGWGDACPVTQRQVVLDLGDLNRILELDPKLGYAVIEPGVTQGQLARALAARAPQWWLESTNAGPDTSIVGNTLERGLGMGERTASVCGLEVVLPDGTTLRTGFGQFQQSRVAHLAKWGVGPSLEGLFSQSNLGVVTRMGIWLAPRPRGAECCLVSVPAADLPRLVDALRPLRLRGVLATNVHIFPAQGHDGRPRWLAVGAVYGDQVTCAAYRADIESAVGSLGPICYFESEPHDPASMLELLELRATPGIDDLFRAGSALCTGQPFAPSPTFLLSYLGGQRVQKSTRAPDSSDPLEMDYGLYFLWVTCPATGRDLKAAIKLVNETSAAFGFRPQLTVQMPTGRAAVLVARICFSRGSDAERSRASRCYRAVLQATTDAGFPPWRLGIEGMPMLKRRTVDMALQRRLKGWIDPRSVLAPGRYVWAEGR